MTVFKEQGPPRLAVNVAAAIHRQMKAQDSIEQWDVKSVADERLSGGLRSRRNTLEQSAAICKTMAGGWAEVFGELRPAARQGAA